MRQNAIGRGGPSGAAATTGTGRTTCAGAVLVAAAGVDAGRRGSGRRGVASVLALLYMTIFSALALGFYATVCMSNQVVHNERRAASAQAATESGLAFMRYQLSRVDVPATLTGNDLLTEVCFQLSKNLNSTRNLNGGTVGFGANNIAIPATGFINLDPAGTQRFRVNLKMSGDKLVAKIVAHGGGSAELEAVRAIEVTFAKQPHETTVFGFGVASRGSITTSGASTIKGLTDAARGGILSTSSSPTPVTLNGKAVSGDIGMTNPKATAYLGSGVSVGGTTNTTLIHKDHVKTGVPEPRFPDVDTAVYSKYATNTYVSGMTYLDNVRVPAGVTASVSGGTIRGVLYLEKGASLRCSGSTTVQGVIVGSNESTGDLDKHVIEFGGSVTAKPLADLPESFGEVRTLTGAFIIAPTYRVRLWGNFGAILGTIICGQFQMGGSAEGTIVGTIVQMLDVPMTISGSADVVIAGTGDGSVIPLGVTFGTYFAPQRMTYLEVAP